MIEKPPSETFGVMRHLRLALLVLAALLGFHPALAARNDAALLLAPENGSVRAFVIGIDRYRNLSRSRDAVADVSATNPQGKPIRIASRSGQKGDLAGLAASLTPFEVVAPDADPAPDIIWDAVTDEAFSANGDKIASEVTKADLPGLIDRTAAIRDLKALVAAAPQELRVLPEGSLHRRGSLVEIEIAHAAGRALVLVDVTGNGAVEMLYPLRKNKPVLDSDSYPVPFLVRAPFGTDEVVAVTSAQSLSVLQRALQDLDGRRSAGRLIDVLTRSVPSDARIGLVDLFTAP